LWSALLAAGLVAVLTASAWSQFRKGEGTWPTVSVSLSIEGNVYILEGRTQAQTGQIIWRRPIGPIDQPVTLQHGWMTSFVTVGNRQFVVDNATGQAQEVAYGSVYRRLGAGATTEPSSSELYAVNGTAVVAPPAGALAPSPGNLTARRVEAQQATVEDLYRAQQQYLYTLAVLDNLPADATAAQRETARQSAEQARAQLRTLETALYQQLQNTLAAERNTAAPTTRETVTEEHRRVQLAQQRVTDAAARATRAEQQVARLREQPGVTTGQLEAALADLAQANQQLAAEQRELTILRMNAEFPPRAVLPPDLRSQIGRTERAVIDQMESVHVAQDRLRRTRQAHQAGSASPEELALAGTHLLAELEKLDSVRRELEDLRQTAVFIQTQKTSGEPPTATTTRPGANWPPLPGY
jgi:hypothetical protein